jgi:hypothetical protein
MSVHFATNPKHKAVIAELILNSDKPLRIEIDEGEQRTIEQNARHWALIQGAHQYLSNEGIWDGDPQALHEYCKRMILGEKAYTLGDQVIKQPIASRKMTKKQFSVFDEKLEPFLLNDLGVPVDYLLPNQENW